MLYVGVDAHKATSQITVVNETGSILKRAKVASTSSAFQQALSEYDEPLTAVLEASYCWGPIYDWLDDLTEEVVLAHPSKVRAIAEARIKTDKIDSAILAHLLRADLIPKAYAPSKETRALKRVLRQRLFLVQLSTMVKNRIRALLSQHEVQTPQVSDLFGKAGMVWLETVELTQPDSALLHEDRELLVLGQAAALYCRVSTADQTCGRQERDLRIFAKKAGYKVVGVWKETASGAKDKRAERKKVLALAQSRDIDVILVTELTRWGRSMLDLFHTLQDLQLWGVSLVAQTGLQFDLRSAQGKLIASLMAALAEFERDLLRERVRSGIAAARQRGVVFGRRPGQRVKADRYAAKVLKLVGEGQSYREISHRLGLSKNTLLDIVKRDRATGL